MATNKNLISQYFTKPDNSDEPNKQSCAKKAHLWRKNNLKMYQQAYKRNLLDPNMSCVLHEDLAEYTKLSMKENSTGFDQFLTELGINIGSSDWKCTMKEFDKYDVSRKDSKCECKEITDNSIAELFQASDISDTHTTEQIISLNPTVTIPTRISQEKIEMNDGASNDIVTFDLQFKRIRNLTEQNSAISSKNRFCQSEPSTSKDATAQNKPNISQALNLRSHSPPNEASSAKTIANPWINRPFSNNKRKFEPNCDENERPAWQNSNRSYSLKDETVSELTFKTGFEELQSRYDKKYGNGGSPSNSNQSYVAPKKSLGGRRTVQSKFVPPFAQQQQKQCENINNGDQFDDNIDDRLKHIEPKMVELIRNEIMNRFSPVSWDDIAGLDYAKTIIQEAVVWPILRPDIFTGLRRPPRGILLFGPPGTGKTLIGKCIASQSKSTFFSISASSLTSKWIGEGEKMVRALFAVAATHQPAVIFIDEIDSLLCQRSETEHESSRRMKTEFLVQLDGASTTETERILIVGATNRPQELDEAARRRLVKRLYIPLPDLSARTQILNNLLKTDKAEITSNEICEIGRLTDGFSGADMKVLCHEASMGPIRAIPSSQMKIVDINDVRALNYNDFLAALKRVRASVSQNDLKYYIEWNKTYGSGTGK